MTSSSQKLVNNASYRDKYHKQALSILVKQAARTGEPLSVIADKIYRANARKISPKLHSALAAGIRDAVENIKHTYSERGNNTENKANPQSHFNLGKCVQRKIDSTGMPHDQALAECRDEAGSEENTDNNTKSALFSGSYRNPKPTIAAIFEFNDTGGIAHSTTTTAEESRYIKSAARKYQAKRINNIQGFEAALTTYEHRFGASS